MKRMIAGLGALALGSAMFLDVATTANAQSAPLPSPLAAQPAATTAPLTCAALPTPVAPAAPTNTGSGAAGSTVVTFRLEAGVVIQLDSAGRPAGILTNYGGAPTCTGVEWSVLQAGAASGAPASLTLINKTLAVTDLGGDWSTVTWHQIG